jgi:hypothetical protein
MPKKKWRLLKPPRKLLRMRRLNLKRILLDMRRKLLRPKRQLKLLMLELNKPINMLQNQRLLLKLLKSRL